VPYLHSWAGEATRSGRPLIMTLALEFQYAVGHGDGDAGE
jgi:hypothetical protein